MSGSDGVSAENHLPSHVLSELHTLEVSRVSEIFRAGGRVGSGGGQLRTGSEVGQAWISTYLPSSSGKMILCKTQCPLGDRESNRLPPRQKKKNPQGPREESVVTG